MSERLLISILAAMLAGCASLSAPTTETGPSPTGLLPTPTARPTPSARSMPSPTAAPATPGSSPAPSLDAEGLEVIELEATGCPGGVVLEWSPAADAEFHHYTALRSVESDVASAYPPIAPAVDWGDSYATDRFVTSAVDASLIPSEAMFSYRVMAYDADDGAVAASPVRRARPAQMVDLGTLQMEEGSGGATGLKWTLFGGSPACFSSYRVLTGPADGTPSTTLTVISSQATTDLETGGLHAGEAYVVRVDAVRTTTLGSFVVARTETASYKVP